MKLIANFPSKIKGWGPSTRAVNTTNWVRVKLKAVLLYSANFVICFTCCVSPFKLFLLDSPSKSKSEVERSITVRKEGGDILGSEKQRHGCQLDHSYWLSFWLSFTSQRRHLIFYTHWSVSHGRKTQSGIGPLSACTCLVFHRNVTLKFGNTLNSCQCSLRVACFYL